MIAFLLAAVVAAPPFWKAKPQVYKSIHEDRAVVVSVKTEDLKDDQKKLIMISAGRIHAPLDFTHQQVTDYGNYSKLLPHMVESVYDKSTRNLFLHGALLGYHVRMTMHMTPKETKTGHQIAWEVVSGNYMGMTGVITEDRDGPEHTEISMDASYTAKDLGLPPVISVLVLEIAGKTAATRMRGHIEEEWEKAHKKTIAKP